MVYVDLLVLEDLFMNYIVLLGTGIVLNRITKFKKIFLSSVIGTITLIFYFLSINKIFLFLITFLFAIFMSLISFSHHNILYTFKNIFYMYFMGAFLEGTLYLINTNIILNTNSYIVKLILLIILTPIVTIIYIKSMRNIRNNNSNYYIIDIYFKDKPKITLESFLDTGNKLIDPYTHKPVILVSKDKIETGGMSKIFIPYNTIDNHSLLTCVYTEKIYIHKIGERKKILVGLVDNINIDGADCILNQKLLD